VPAGLEIRQVYGLLFTRDGRLLLTAEEKDGDMVYSLAGGHPEASDDGMEGTLRREVLEEINTAIGRPILVGYQEIIGDGSTPFAQVRMAALIEVIGERLPDPATGRTFLRALIPAAKAAENLNWGEVGKAMVRAAVRIAGEKLGIQEFGGKEEWV